MSAPAQERGDGDRFTPHQRLAGLLAFGASVALTVLALLAVHLLLRSRFPPPEDMHPARVNFNPEPVERLQYLVGLALLPLLLLASYAAFRRLTAGLAEGTASRIERCAGGAIAAGVIGLTVTGLLREGRFLWGPPAGWWDWTGPAIAAASLAAEAALCAALFRPGPSPRLVRARARAATAVSGLAVALIALAGLCGVIGLGNVATTDVFLINFSAVFQPVVQVHLGRGLLADMPSQYGLYPYAIEPLFRITGLSVLSFSVVMALLNVAAFLAIFGATRSLVGDRLLAGLAMVAVLSTYLWGRGQGGDPYFQYHPIRFLFPCLVVSLAWRYFARRERAVYWAGFALGAIGVLWNADSGVVAMLSWLLVLCYGEAASRAWRKIPGHLLVAAGSLAGTAALFTLYLLLRHGRVPDYQDLVYYQRLFYLKGYGMLPMPALHPWNAVALVYAAGLLYSAMSLVEGAASPKAALVFLLSVMGAGLFSYYQGRSADGNLVAAAYPAVLLASFFADALLRPAAVRSGPWRFPLVALCACFLAFCAVRTVALLPETSASVTRRLAALARGDETNVTRAARFVREHTRPGEEVMILSFLQSIYHLESRTISPPGLLWFGAIPVDLQRRNAALWSAAWRARKVFVTGEWNLLPLRDRMRQRFTVVASTPDGYMSLLAPGPPAAPGSDVPDRQELQPPL